MNYGDILMPLQINSIEQLEIFICGSWKDLNGNIEIFLLQLEFHKAMFAVAKLDS